MSKFVDLKYVTRDGLEAPLDRSNPDSPYCGVGQSDFGRLVKNSFINRISWSENGVVRNLNFPEGAIGVVDPLSDVLAVVVLDRELSWPNNAAVYRPDGVMDHRISVPPFVEMIVEHLPGFEPRSSRFPVEYVDEVLIQDGRTLFGLCFSYEWVERRFYDPANRRWLERDQIYRR